jgi:hypothetical protein
MRINLIIVRRLQVYRKIIKDQIMLLSDIISVPPYWYIFVTFIFAIYFSYRGIWEWVDIADQSWSWWKKLIRLYIQEFIFKFIITISSFGGLFVGYRILLSIKSLGEIGTGTAALLIFLFVWGIIGVCGYLTHIIASGKFPR